MTTKLNQTNKKKDNMKFFETLSATGITDAIIQFSKSEAGDITIFVAPKTITRENPLKSLKPIFISGSAQQLDETFFENLEKNMFDVPQVAKVKPPKKEVVAEVMTAPVPTEEAQQQEAEEEADRQFERDEAVIGTMKPEEIGEELEPKDWEDTDPATMSKPAKVKATKVVKVNNEKVLKDFMTNIGKDTDILNSVEAIEALYDKLSPEELEKPYAKKVRIDVDIRLRKQANYLAALAKNGFTPKPILEDVLNGNAAIEDVVAEAYIEEQELNDAPPIAPGELEEYMQKDFEATKERAVEQIEDYAKAQNLSVAEVINEIAVESPNVIIATIAGPEKVVDIIKEVPSIPTPMPIPLPTPPVPVQVFEEVEELQMITTDYTYEQMNSVGWTDEMLIENGYAKMVTVKKLVIAPGKLSYTMPKPFDQ